MFLDKFILTVLFIFIIVPDIILSELGLEPEKMNIIPFLLVWTLLIATVVVFVRGIFWITRSLRR